jgi:signal transduction histidine kinase
LVQSSLTAARLDGEQVETSLARYSLAGIIDHLCLLQAKANGVERLTTEHGNPGAFAWCDCTLTEQVLANLISNALKYSPGEQPVRITTAQEGGQAVCRVANGGPGIPSAERDRLFERFFRGGNAAGTDGIGLGLNIARHLARIQQGDLEVSSSLGEGTVFILRLPAADHEVAPDAPA